MKNDNILETVKFNYENYKKENDSIKKIEICLDYISERLKNQQISVMVGAGYSLNANLKKTNQEQQYEDWLALLENAYKQLYPDNKECINGGNSKEIRNKIQSIGESVVAEQYERAKGSREALDLYIENRILKIDETTDDLSLHEKLLKLNWNDIITTNWDHLLERANKKNQHNYYEVYRAKDLRGRPDRRIIKLHGSIRTPKEIDNKEYKFDDTYNYLYLITETDFRNYKTEHEDFSNFMKVKMLETPFCLMGFSGRDSNFKYWVKELKRTMQKGGNTEEPNPIFLFDVNPNPTKPEDKEYEETLELFYSNNYIIRLRILDFYNYKNPQINSISTVQGCNVTSATTPGQALRHSDLNNFILDYLIENSSIHEDKNEEKSDDDIIENDDNEKKNDSKKNKKLVTKKTNQKKTQIIQNIAASNLQSISNDDIAQYNQTELFDYTNIQTASVIINRVQLLYNSLNNWNENTFIFLYKWTIGNLYSLTNIYEEEKIENIIQLYFSKNFQNTEAYVFLELILKYYREAQKYNEFDSILKEEEPKLKLKNICTFEKANLFVDKLNYKELKELLINWTPENDENPDSIFIIRKLSLINTFENIYLTEDERNVIKKTFEKSLEVCNETQYKYFIAIYQKQFLQKHTFEVNYFNQPLIDSLIGSGAVEVYKYLDNFKKEIQKNDYKSNISKRYAITRNLSFSSGNEDLINTIRIFNFFEYTGLPMSMFFNNSKLIEIIPDIKKTEYYLIKILIQAVSYFGNDSEEDYMRNILNKTLRFIKQENIIGFYKACFDILKFKIENKKDIRSYLFLVSELSNYISKENSEDFFDFLYLQIQNPTELNLQLFNLIRRGKVWGIERPFLQFIQRISEPEKFKSILRWVIQEYIEDEKELVKQKHYSFSPFYSYYFELLKKNFFKNEIKIVFSEKEMIKFLEEDFNYEKQLCLYGYEYLSEELKQKTKDYFESDYSLHTDPYFIKHFKSDELKKHIFKRLKQYNIIAFDSRDYPFSNYIRMLNQEKMLDENDKKEVCGILSVYYDQIQNDVDHFKYGFRSLKDILASLYFCLEDILSDEEKEKIPELKTAYEKIKNEFISQIQNFYDFKWLYAEDLQQFRLYFSNAISYFSYLHQAKQYLYIFNISLTKLIVQNDANFEAVLELFIRAYTNGYEKNVFVNSETHELLIQIMKKFELEIPYCYDYLFITKQMQLLAEALNKNNIKNDVIDYWLENKD